MRRDPIVVQRGTTIAEGIAAIQEVRADCLLVAGDGALAGILTERDVLLKVLGRDVDLTAAVDDFMTAGPDALTPDATMGEALALMDRGGYRHVPLVDEEGRIAGLLRQQDILAYVAEAFPEAILNLPPRPHQRLDAQDGA
jgi:CBS domain-containing protein